MNAKDAKKNKSSGLSRGISDLTTGCTEMHATSPGDFSQTSRSSRTDCRIRAHSHRCISPTSGPFTQIRAIDHIVLTVRDIDATCRFYARALGMRITTFGAGRKALTFGSQKINLHRYGGEFEPKARVPTPGSADLCLVTDLPIAQVLEHLRATGVEVLEGPVERTGAVGPILSVYFRDPDGNLIEVSSYLIPLEAQP
jgi:catechol 2,3-dioxygenase-like lactoylglutathione lyase family enzyme